MNAVIPAALPRPVLPFTIPLVLCKFYNHASRAVIDAIVLHSMESQEKGEQAEQCAHYLATLPDQAPKKSVHYMVDSNTVIQGVPDHNIAYGCGGANATCLHIEHAGQARQTRSQWQDPYSASMLELWAQLCARLCSQWHIPAVYVPAAGLVLRKRGITTHADCSLAFGQSTHTDPGPGFPMDWYVSRVGALMYRSAEALA